MGPLYEAPANSQPGTHLLAIGVGSYPHLLGGNAALANRPLGLKQLESPPVSLKAVLDWFLGPTLWVGSPGFVNPAAPVASVDALLSSPAPLTIDTPAGARAVGPATLDAIQGAFDAWLDRLKSHADNIGVFYFCGHGVMVSEHFLLAQDFGESSGRPWKKAFDISTTIRAVQREVPGAVYYFVDACREISRDVAVTIGGYPDALLTLDLGKRVVGKSVTAIYATGEGARAFAPPGGQLSRFTSALVCVLSGYCGIKAPGATYWTVDGESIAWAVRRLFEFEEMDASGKANDAQVITQHTDGCSVPLLRLPAAPKVKVRLDVSPSKRRALYELYLRSAKGTRIAQTMLNQVFITEVPRGFYEIGAQDPTGTLAPVLREDEELIPPMYPFTFEVQQ